MRNTINKLVQFARYVKQLTLALYFAIRHPDTPLLVEWLGIAVLGYALSPIDLIPDFIPILGYLDELILLPLGVYLVIKLLPPPVWEQCVEQGSRSQLQLPKNRYAAGCIMLIWLIIISAISYGLWLSMVE